jgi:hypothetical protein
VDDYMRVCALPGCDVSIEDIPGRPVRRYCTAAHRAAARQARRASMQPDQQERLAETLPWLREPDAEPVLAPAASVHAEPVPAARVPAPPARRSFPARLGEHRPRRRRAIAVIGAAGILAGGYAVTSSQSSETAGPTQQTPRGESSDGWAARAEVTLTSVDRQLDTIARTEAAWNALPQHTAVATPAPVAELMDRKALLERRRAALQSQLDSYRALARTRGDLELAERNLDAIEKALRNTPTSGVVSSPDEAFALAALQEQRDLRIRQRDAKKLELAGIEGNVEKAAKTPLPDDGQQTAAVRDRVLDVIHSGGRDGAPTPTTPTPGPHRPEVLASGREGAPGQERQATTTSAPPDPRGPRDESAERRTEPRPAAQGGPGGKVVDTVDGVLTGGRPDAAEEKPAGTEPGRPAEQPKGPVGKVVDTVGGAVEGLAGGKGQEESAQKESAQKERAQEESAQKESTRQESARQESARQESARQESAPKESAPKESARQSAPRQSTTPAAADGAAQTPSSAPTGGSAAAVMPGSELAMAIVGSVPGGQAALPAVEAAMRQAAAEYGRSPESGSPGSQPPSRSAPTRLTTTVVDDSGSTQEQSSGNETSYAGSSSSPGSYGPDSSTGHSSGSGWTS